MLGFTQPTSAKLHRLSLIEGTGSLLSSNRLVLRLTDKMRYVQAVSLNVPIGREYKCRWWDQLFPIKDKAWRS